MTDKYKATLKNPDIVEANPEIVDEAKYKWAGASAHWMFTPWEKLCHDVISHYI